jgi:hypothetical protein
LNEAKEQENNLKTLHRKLEEFVELVKQAGTRNSQLLKDQLFLAELNSAKIRSTIKKSGIILDTNDISPKDSGLPNSLVSIYGGEYSISNGIYIHYSF